MPTRRETRFDKSAESLARLFIIVALPLVIAFSAACGSPQPASSEETQSTSPPPRRLNDQRALSPAMLRSEIALRGAKAVLNRLWNVPQRMGEGWLAVEEHVADGSDEWLGIAEQLAAVTDAGASHGLEIALHHALAKNPAGVLHMTPRIPFAIEAICANGDDEAEPQQEVHELRAALSAVLGVKVPKLRSQRDRCAKALAAALSPRTCTLEQGEMALKDVVAASPQTKSWDVLYQQFVRYRKCDDGAVAEAFSESVIRLLTDRWPEVLALTSLSKADPAFRIFVLQHIDASLDNADLTKAAQSARRSCVPGAMALCRQIASAASRALAFQRSSGRP